MPPNTPARSLSDHPSVIQRTIMRQPNGYVSGWLWFIDRDGERVVAAESHLFHDEDEANAWADGLIDFYMEADRAI